MTKSRNESIDDNNFFVSFDHIERNTEYVKKMINNAKAMGAKGITILVSNDYITELTDLITLLQSLDIPISGASFPEVIYGDTFYKDAIIVVAWKSEIQVTTFNEISDSESELYNQETSNYEESLNDNRGCLIFVDSRAKSAENALDALYFRSENDYQYAGAGAGFLGNDQLPCIISNEGVVKDALQTIRLSLHQNNNVSYGWTKLSGPHLITDSTKNRVSTIDYLPVKDQYRKFISDNVDEDVSELTIKELFAKYPIGIHHYGEDIIVRDPCSYEDGSIEFFGDIPEFANIYILEGEPDQLIRDVGQSLQLFNQKNSATNTLTLLFTCIGRRFFMGSNSNIELSVAAKKLESNQAIIGTSSFGEIATNDVGLVRFHTLSHVVSRVY